MKRVLILVEGQTEETFVRDILTEHLWAFEVALTPVIASTKRVKSGLKFKGGVTTYRHVRTELALLLRDSQASAVTTMIDYYGLPDDFPGFESLPKGTSCYGCVEHLETALKADLRSPRVLPYFSLHEFETLLFSSPAEVQAAFPDRPVAAPMSSVRRSVASPEEINDGVETHPSARLQDLLPAYQKAFHGPIIARRIGLPALRGQCPHFNGWVSSLERLGQA